MSGQALITGPVRAAVRARRDHDAAREEALYDAIANGHFERDPYAPYATPTEYSAPCGCIAREVKETDGVSEWPEWSWNTSKCTEDA